MQSRQRRTQPVSSDLAANRRFLDDEIGLESCFELVAKKFGFAGREALLVGVDGFIKDGILLYIVDSLTRLEAADVLPNPMEKLHERFVAYMECELMDDMYDAADEIISGPVVLFVDGADQCLVIDSRTYPMRAVEEPDLERVMRGPRDGFGETLVINLALLRRRVRDYSLRTELVTIAARSQTDVSLVYLQDLASEDFLQKIRDSLDQIDVDAAPMAERSVVDFLTEGRKSRLNPYPVVRFTERPDVAAEYLFEGHILIVVDGSPAVIMLPTTAFHHLQHAEEFHESVFNGTFVRLVRYLAVLIAWVGTPLWLVLAQAGDALPPALEIIGPREAPAIPLLVQFLFGEVGVELIRMGLVHTPNALATSLGIIGAVLLGELAVEVGLFNSEVVLYVTVSALAYFAVPSWEMSTALRLSRVLLLIVGGILGPGGLAAALLLNIILLARIDSWGVPYLWPLIPFDAHGFLDILYRRPMSVSKRRPWVLRPGDPTRGG